MAKPVVESRARVDVKARVATIATMMRQGLWRRGESCGALAAEWRIPVSTVENSAAEAWRRVCAEANDADTARPTIAGYLLTNIARADAEGDAVAVAKVADVYSKVIGARAPTQTQEVPMTEEQARARWKELTGKEWGS